MSGKGETLSNELFDGSENTPRVLLELDNRNLTSFSKEHSGTVYGMSLGLCDSGGVKGLHVGSLT